MIRVYKYKLYPSKTQKEILLRQLETLRCLYNRALEMRITLYQVHGETFSLGDMKKVLITQDRRENSALAALNVGACQQALTRLDKAYQAFFRRVKAGKEEPGFPKPRRRGQWNSILFNRLGDGCKLEGNRVYVQYVGHVKMDFYRPFPEGSRPKNLAILKHADTWWCCVWLDIPDIDVAASTLPATGIDVGLYAFVTDAEGNCYEPLNALHRAERKLSWLQHRQDTHHQLGSCRWRELQRQINRLHMHVANQRKEWHILTANALLSRYGTIYHEKLDIREMKRRPEAKECDGQFVPNGAEATKPRRKGISDCAWGQFFQILAQQGAKRGATVVAVPCAYTTQVCAECHKITEVKIELTDKTFCCTHCGHKQDRKHNAARNILRVGQGEPLVQ